MAGIWRISKTEKGARIDYTDFDSGKSWRCGDGIPLKSALGWVGERIGMGDVIEVDGRPFICDFGQHIFNPILQ